MIKSALLMIFSIFILPNTLFAAGYCGSWGKNGSSPYTVSSDSDGTASLTYANVNSCVNTHAVDGDTIIVPSGSQDWSSSLTISNSLSVTIQGSGTYGTYINRTSNPTFYLQPSSGEFVRITNFELRCGVIVNPGSGGYVEVEDAFRVDHIKIDQVTRGASMCTPVANYGPSEGVLGVVAAPTFGVFDSCEITVPGDTGILQLIPYRNATNDGCGLTAWTQDAGWGGKKFVYLEDSTITNTSNSGPFATAAAFDGCFGGKQVIRHNTIQNFVWGHHDQADQNRHSFRAKQISNNTWKMTDSAYWTAGSGTRGGGLLVFSNRVSMGGLAGGSQPLYVNDYLQGSQYGAWGHCDGDNAYKFCIGPNLPRPMPTLAGCTSQVEEDALSGGCTTNADCGSGNYCVPINNNEDPLTGWVCREQIGAGAFNATTGVHSLDPAYQWDNLYCTGSSGNCTPGTNMQWYVAAQAPAIEVERDVRNDTKPGFSDYTYPHPLRGTTPPSAQGCTISGASFR